MATSGKIHKALHHLYWCLEQDLRLTLPMSYDQGNYAITCTTLLRHRQHSDVLRVFRQSFNAQARDYNVLANFSALTDRQTMTNQLFSLWNDQERLVEMINVPVGQDSDWVLEAVVSVVINVQLWVKPAQLEAIGLARKKIRHFVVPAWGGKPRDMA